MLVGAGLFFELLVVVVRQEWSAQSQAMSTLLDSVWDSDGTPAAGRILDVARVMILPDLKPARAVFCRLVLTCLAGTPQ